MLYNLHPKYFKIQHWVVILCSVVLILATLPLSLLFSVKVVQVRVWFLSSS
jgi:hypothetical protein